MYIIDKIKAFESSDGVTNWMKIIYKESLKPTDFCIDKEFSFLELKIYNDFHDILISGSKKEIIKHYE